MLDWGTEQWDAFGSVAGGVFAGLAFCATAILLYREARNRRSDERERERLRRDDEARLARLIISESGHPNIALRTGATWVVPIRIKNYGDVPVFNVRAWITERDVFANIPVLEPGEERTLECETFLTTLNSGELPTAPTVLFMDSTGRWWEREGNHQPKRLLGYDPSLHVSRWRPYDPKSGDKFPSGRPLP